MKSDEIFSMMRKELDGKFGDEGEDRLLITALAVLIAGSWIVEAIHGNTAAVEGD